MFVFIIFKILQKYKHGQCFQNTIMYYARMIQIQIMLRIIKKDGAIEKHLQCMHVAFTFMLNTQESI